MNSYEYKRIHQEFTNQMRLHWILLLQSVMADVHGLCYSYSDVMSPHRLFYFIKANCNLIIKLNTYCFSRGFIVS